MKIDRRDPPRTFHVSGVDISHVADIELDPDELITFKTESGSEWDVSRKSFGWYATPSLNRRLPEHGLRGALVANADGRVAVLLVEPARMDDFDAYCEEQSMRVLTWLDTDDVAAKLER